MRYRTRVVELARRGARAEAENHATVYDDSWSSDGPCDFRRLFLAHYARIRATCLAFAEPGVALFAFATGDRTWQGSMCLAARPGEIRAGVIGRHSAADLFLDSPTLALRHLAVLLEPLPLRAALRGEVRFRVMDLETGSPPRDEHGRAVASLTAEGPVFLTCDRFAFLALVTGDPTDWPERAADAWDIQPERIFVDERLAEGSAPRRLPPVPRASPHRASTVIRLLDGPRHLAVRGTDDPADGHLHLASAHGRLRLPVGGDSLHHGLLVGRYERCRNHAASPLLDDRVSRVHLLLLDIAGRPVAVDLASSNGTFAFDPATSALIPIRIHHLGPGDLLALAGPGTVLSWHPVD